MSTEKNTNRHYCQVGIESTYGGTTVALPTSDTTYSFHTHEPPTFTNRWQFDGNLDGQAAPGGSPYPNIIPYGRARDFSLVSRFRKPSSTYSASVFPEVLTAARGHGYGATFSSSPTPRWTLAPQRSGFSSLAVDGYVHGELEHVYGAYLSSLTIEAEGAAPPVWTFEGSGIANATTDASVPSIGYPAVDRLLQRAVYGSTPVLTLTKGGQTPPLRVRSFRFRSERPVEERMTGTTAEHPGFALGNDVVTLECVVEAMLVTGVTSTPWMATSSGRFNPRALYEAGETFTATLTVGALGFTITSSTNACFTGEPERDAAAPIALWNLAMRFNATSEVNADSHTILFPYS